MTSAAAIPGQQAATDRDRLRTGGRLGAAASVAGAAFAVAIIAWDPMVPSDRFSYPFDARWFVVWQLVFTVQHLAMLPLFTGLLLLERRRPTRTLRVGTWIALAGQVVLTAMELLALIARNAPLQAGRGALVGALYAIPMLMLGVGLVVAGVGAVRARLFDGATRWLVLALGVFVFVVLFPAVFGPMVAGRIAIGVWLLGFAALGLAIGRART